MPATPRPRRAFGAATLGVLLAALALLCLSPAGPLGAQPSPPPDGNQATIATPPLAPPTAREVPRLALEIYDSVMSPFCPGLLLSNCPSPAADSLRTAIADRVERGDTRAAIEAELYATYGEAVRAAPKASGFGLVAWLAPAVVLLGGGLWLALWLRRAASRRTERVARAAVQSSAAPTLAAAALPAGGADAARAAELARLDRLVRGEGR